MVRHLKPVRVKTPLQQLASARTTGSIRASRLLGEQLARQAAKLPLGTCVLEFPFNVARRWRFDAAWPAVRVAVEIEGGVWSRGRHTRGKGFASDMEKYNDAVINRWQVLRVTPLQVRNGEAISLLGRLLDLMP